MSKDGKASAAAAQLLIDDEPDDWCVQLRGLQRKNGLTKRVGTRESSVLVAQVRGSQRVLERAQLTYCIDENAKLTDCYYEKKDWRVCKQEVSWWSLPDGVACLASEAEM